MVYDEVVALSPVAVMPRDRVYGRGWVPPRSPSPIPASDWDTTMGPVDEEVPASSWSVGRETEATPPPPPPRKRARSPDGPSSREAKRSRPSRVVPGPSVPAPVHPRPPPTAPRAHRRPFAPDGSRLRASRVRGAPPVVQAVPLSRASGPSVFFRGESYRPVGDVVRGLIPQCFRCVQMHRICSVGGGPAARNTRPPSKGRSACDLCHARKACCPSWSSFRETYQAREDMGNFRFQHWEHIGRGEFAPLEPDVRLVDLTSIGKGFSVSGV